MPASSRTSTQAGGPRASQARQAFADWARTDGLVWLYIFKAIAAALLALGVAMKLDLPSPRTAMTTVFIVMQPQSGPVFAKSFYRICGTLVGLVVMLALIGVFAQQPELFIASTALWVGICTAGAARNRNFRSYGFVLAGYTAALIGIPASQHPDGAFMSAMTRVAEISLGIIASGFVSAVVFPQYTGELLRATVRQRFSSFVDYVSASLGGKVERSRIEATNARFVADIVGFEASRSTAVFESPDARMRAGRLARLNTEFMTVSTRFHALHQLMNRLRESGSTVTVDALEPYFREIAPLFDKAGEPVLSAADAVHAAAQLENYRATLPKRVRETRVQLEADLDQQGKNADTRAARLLDFDTATELFYRFVHEMNEYTATYASLAVDTHSREKWVARYVPKTNLVAAAVAGLRAAIVMGLLAAFWIASAWPSGANLVLTAAATCALASASPQPARMSSQMAGGTMLASVVGMFLTFGVFPHIDGFPMLCVALAPALALGVFLTTRPAYMGYGMGYCIFLCFLVGPDNVVQYNPAGYMNDALSLVMSMIVTAAAFVVLLPPSAPWLRKRLLANLRGQAVHACRARWLGSSGLAGLRNRFESGARDLMFQLQALAGNDEALRHDTLRWMFATLEIGNAALDLREELAAVAERAPWRDAAEATLKAVSAVFERPDANRHATALAVTGAAIAACQGVLEQIVQDNAPRETRHRLQRILSHLHFIRTALIDPQSPFAAYVNHPVNQPAPAQGANHAA
ncbi:p-hydroxybenzoic acid efflux pump subunit AaeB [Paraburkholderia caffeinitolerans]|uniref:p-hydroxybenzoic acid efflux pump subunit AaeB n=1 Tax=Paraburkholderia caffeinitolerans TaxID=1723730 RepID=A0A6J5GH11_9BURK|nr:MULTISPECIES: FUSC family protein [Paraburkholderia]CAB3799202.1 p-hydroxybenzoic acid efflux pump subunit AaeB [Paraburkholderia caffeinitolerans]